MKSRVIIFAVSAVTVLSVAGSAQAGARSFANCASMSSVYANGVARTAKAASHPFPFWIRVRAPWVDTNTYNANRRLDRDGDGIACEVST
jgi:hypothetical protein